MPGYASTLVALVVGGGLGTIHTSLRKSPEYGGFQIYRDLAAVEMGPRKIRTGLLRVLNPIEASRYETNLHETAFGILMKDLEARAVRRSAHMVKRNGTTLDSEDE